MKDFMNWLIENWAMIIAIIAVIVAIVAAIYRFTKLPTEEQKSKVKQCLLNWVVEAEKNLGGGTGKVKLSMVYGWFVTAFPVLKNFITFETFSTWVDEALEEMKTMLATNQNLKNVVEGNLLEISEIKGVETSE